jgi:hypothetical protein
MDKTSKYVARMDEQLRQFDADLDRVAQAAARVAPGARGAYDASMDELREGRAAAQKAFEQLRVSTAQTGAAQMQSRMRVAYHTLQKALEKVSADLGR